MSSALWMLTAVNLICYLDRYIIAAAAPQFLLQAREWLLPFFHAAALY